MNQQFQEALQHIIDGNEKTFAASAPLFAELLATSGAKTRPIILVVKNQSDIRTRYQNLCFFANSQQTVRFIPHDERTVMHATATDPLLRMERMAIRFRLSMGEVPPILLLSPESLIERGLSARDLQKHAQLISTKEQIDRDLFIRALATLGYSKVPHVYDRGTYSVRGSIIDVFVNGEKHPVRIDFFGNEIESIKYFDENSQRSFSTIDSMVIGGVKEIFLDDETITTAQEKLTDVADALNFPTQKLNEKLRDIEQGIHFYGMEKLLPAFYRNLSSLLEVLVASVPKDQLPHIIFEDKEAIFAELRDFERNIDDLYRQACIRGDLIFAKDEYFTSIENLRSLLTHFSCTDIVPFSTETVPQFVCHDTRDIRHDILKASVNVDKDAEPHLLKPLADRLKKFHAKNFATIISVSSYEHEQELKRLLEPFGINLSHSKALPEPQTLFASYRPHVHAYTTISSPALAFGATFDFLSATFIAEDDIFGKRTKRKESSGKKQSFGTAISDLEPDDYIVHVDHGVGQFKGLVRLNVRGVDNDYILLVYANAEKLYLPTHRINLIKPYGRNKEIAVRLDKLGGTAWISKKKKVKEAVMAMAHDLLKLYAKREVVERPPFIAPDAHYVEFEANFEFETTRDQQKAINDVIADMQRKRPMDRLVCGDVGYGKTEVAMRAAMLAVLSNRQVALLSPTTVLAQQHGITFKERFRNTGVSIAVLSRFQKAKEIKQILDDVQKKRVDIVIGTHRLLSSDVHFHDLGLIVVDEEQRFGIKAKEHLKKMRTKVDVLTMSATPIPRTMQMSYFGIRDLSIIETPPVDRRAIETQVAQFDDAVIKEAIERELSRGGQVYFVHNRVQSIAAIADYLKNLVPDARIAVAHGQMDEKDLEDVMLRFMSHEINVLVCTTIIETGIDVPTANTMFINDADDFGLSQLYQLRGRIGRSKERAFAFLLIKQKTEHLTPIARTRLEILHKFSELGVGFRIAQHDLELRGAGDLLGKNQHGHMAAVGYDLYAELLQEAVKELKGQTDDDAIDPEVIVPMSALIPEHYCSDLAERMSFYQRLAIASSVEKIHTLMADLEDQYGEAPDEVLTLKICALIKLELKKIRALKLELARDAENKFFTVSISLSNKAPVDHQKLLVAMKENARLRITPQHKVIQTVPIAHVTAHDAALHAAMHAIDILKKELFMA